MQYEAEPPDSALMRGTDGKIDLGTHVTTSILQPLS
jgi:hypothetical protein